MPKIGNLLTFNRKEKVGLLKIEFYGTNCVCVFIFFNFKDDLTLCLDKLWVNSVHLCELVNAPLSLKKKNMVQLCLSKFHALLFRRVVL